MASWSELVRTANWLMVYYVSIVHFGALAGIRCLFDCKWSTLIWFGVFYYLSGLGITAGCHRLWAHKSYKAHDSVRFFLMLCSSMANQGTIAHWCRDHRVHHKYSDTPADPHDSTRGFFFSHMGWLLVKKDKRVIQGGKNLNFDDLFADWVVVLQHKLNPWGQLFMCFVFPTLVTVWTTTEHWVNALFICGFLRYVAVLHATWLVNSAAHFFGYQPYDPTMPPRENKWVSIFAMGEGWHNWHHKFPYDYATSEFGASIQFNPTKLTIDFLALLGLVTDRKRAVSHWEQMKIKERETKEPIDSLPNGEVLNMNTSQRAYYNLTARAM